MKHTMYIILSNKKMQLVKFLPRIEMSYLREIMTLYRKVPSIKLVRLNLYGRYFHTGLLYITP